VLCYGGYDQTSLEISGSNISVTVANNLYVNLNGSSSYLLLRDLDHSLISHIGVGLTDGLPDSPPFPLFDMAILLKNTNNNVFESLGAECSPSATNCVGMAFESYNGSGFNFNNKFNNFISVYGYTGIVIYDGNDNNTFVKPAIGNVLEGTGGPKQGNPICWHDFGSSNTFVSPTCSF
jgi:hypothetical protein